MNNVEQEIPEALILLGMDGVIANFLESACKRHGRQYVPSEIKQFNISESWGLTPGEFWHPLKGVEFWENISPYPYSKNLFEGLTSIAPVSICTSPSNDFGCLEGKSRWLKAHFGLSVPESIFCHKKWLLANPETILIDDKASTCNRFDLRGGKSIVYPQPWNDGHGGWESVVERAKEMVYKIKDYDPDDPPPYPPEHCVDS